MTFVFIDTGPWIALLDRRDGMHIAAVDQFKRLKEERARLLTTNYVISEAATRLRYDSGLAAALALRDSVAEAAAARRLRVRWVDQRLEREAWELIERYPKLRLSLTDATSAAAAKRAGIDECFTFDRDFRALGFKMRP